MSALPPLATPIPESLAASLVRQPAEIIPVVERGFKRLNGLVQARKTILK